MRKKHSNKMSPKTSSLFDMRHDEFIEEMSSNEMSSKPPIEMIEIIEQFSSIDLGNLIDPLDPDQPQEEEVWKLDPQQQQQRIQPELRESHTFRERPASGATVRKRTSFAASIRPMFSNRRHRNQKNKQKKNNHDGRARQPLEEQNRDKNDPVDKTRRKTKSKQNRKERELRRQKHLKKVQFVDPSENRVYTITHYQDLAEQEMDNLWESGQELEDNLLLGRSPDDDCLDVDVEELLLGEDYRTCSPPRGRSSKSRPRFETTPTIGTVIQSGKGARKARTAVMNVQEFHKNNAIRMDTSSTPTDIIHEDSKWEMIADVYRACSEPSACVAHETAVGLYQSIHVVRAESPPRLRLTFFQEGMFQTSPKSVAAIVESATESQSNMALPRGHSVPDIFFEEGIVAFS